MSMAGMKPVPKPFTSPAGNILALGSAHICLADLHVTGFAGLQSLQLSTQHLLAASSVLPPERRAGCSMVAAKAFPRDQHAGFASQGTNASCCTSALGHVAAFTRAPMHKASRQHFPNTTGIRQVVPTPGAASSSAKSCQDPG